MKPKLMRSMLLLAVGSLILFLVAAFVGKPFDHDEIVHIITRYAR